MTRTVEFRHTLSRTVPHDHDVELRVTASVRHVRGEPGSAAITDGWEIDSCAARGVRCVCVALTDAEQREIENAAIKRAQL